MEEYLWANFLSWTYSGLILCSQEDYAEVIKNAPNLEVLEWDNVLSAPEEQGDQYPNAKGLLFAFASLLAKLFLIDQFIRNGLKWSGIRCRSLHTGQKLIEMRYVRSGSINVGLVDDYEIVRDECGLYQSFRLSTTKGVCFTTTSWNLNTTRFM